MKQICTVSDVKRLGTILCLGAHPDDETFMAGGLLAAAAQNGQQVICVTATKGEKGIQDEKRWPHERLGEIRQTELQRALDLLGVQNHYWLPYTDGACEKVDSNEAASLLRPIFEKHQPDTVLTFGPDGLTGHPDHAAMPGWATEALQTMDQQPAIYHAVVPQDLYEEYLHDMDKQLNIFFNIEEPPLQSDEKCAIALKLPRELCRLKCDALFLMESQTGGLFHQYDNDTICSAWAKEVFIIAK